MNSAKKSEGKILLSLLATLIVGLIGGVLISNYTTLGQNLGSGAGVIEKAEKEVEDSSRFSVMCEGEI